jgi:hypothetical protein
LCILYLSKTIPGSAKANRRKPKSCFGQVFNFKFGCFFVKSVIAWHRHACPHVELKAWPGFCPVSLSLSIIVLFLLLLSDFLFQVLLVQEDSEAKLNLENCNDAEASKAMIEALEAQFLKKADESEEHRDLLLGLAQEAAERNVI